MTTTFKFKNE